MTSTTIRYSDSEFVAPDLPIEVWMLEVVKQIDADDPWSISLKEEWQLQATSGFEFGPAPALDEFAASNDRRQILKSLFLKAIDSLSLRSGSFTTDELSDMGVGGCDVIYSNELPTQIVIDVGRQFLSLITNVGSAHD